MADQKTTDLTALTVPIESDIIYIVDDPGGTPLSRKITVANLRKLIDSEKIVFGTGGDADIEFNGTDWIFDYDHANAGTTDFRIQEDGTDRFVILTGGNVHIGVVGGGTSTLNVEGSGLLLTNSSDTDSKHTLDYNSNHARIVMSDTAGVSRVVLNTASSSYFNGGNLGVGLTNPGGRLDILGSTITSSGTDDFISQRAITLNDTGAAGGSDIFRGDKTILTLTDITGWDNVYLFDYLAGGSGTTQMMAYEMVTTTVGTLMVQIGTVSRPGYSFVGNTDTGLLEASSVIQFVIDGNFVVGVGAAGITFTDETIDIGTSSIGLNDLHFGSGGVINFDGGDVLLTHTTDTLTLTGGVLALPSAGLTAAGNIDIGAVDFRSATLTADGLTSGRVVFATTNGQLTDDADFLFSGSTLSVGLAATSTGIFNLSGATSGVVSVTVAATAGTWTMTLPAAVGGSGEQLTDAAGNGITSWSAASSLREHKDIFGKYESVREAFDTIVHTNVYKFKYRDGLGTGDSDTKYVGIMADEASWAMHFGGKIVNPVNTLGYMVLGFRSVDERIEQLEHEILILKEV